MTKFFVIAVFIFILFFIFNKDMGKPIQNEPLLFLEYDRDAITVSLPPNRPPYTFGEELEIHNEWDSLGYLSGIIFKIFEQTPLNVSIVYLPYDVAYKLFINNEIDIITQAADTKISETISIAFFSFKNMLIYDSADSIRFFESSDLRVIGWHGAYSIMGSEYREFIDNHTQYAERGDVFDQINLLRERSVDAIIRDTTIFRWAVHQDSLAGRVLDITIAYKEIPYDTNASRYSLFTREDSLAKLIERGLSQILLNDIEKDILHFFFMRGKI